MDLSFSNIILTSTGIVTAMGGTYYTILKIMKELKKAKKAEFSNILEEAKDHSNSLKNALENRLSMLEFDLINLKNNVAKDLDHIKETQASEIKNLGEKIEDLREDLKNQHQSILNLLTKLVDKN